MATTCRAFQTEDEARVQVERLLASGTSGDDIRVRMGAAMRDQAEVPVGSFAGVAGSVGAFAGHPAGDGVGTYAGDASEQRTGGFGDIDRETVTTYADGVKRVEIVSHHDLQHILVDAGLDAATAAADVEALHHGRVLVLSR